MPLSYARDRLDEADLLFLVASKFIEIDLHPQRDHLLPIIYPSIQASSDYWLRPANPVFSRGFAALFSR